MVALELGIIAICFVFLIKSAQELTTRLVRLAKIIGLPEFTTSFLVIGIIAVLPELSIGINSALRGESSFGLGIVFGSNIADLTLIIGFTALFANSLRLHNSTIKEIKTMLATTTLPVVMLLDGEISRTDGALLLAAFIIYIYIVIRSHRHPQLQNHKNHAPNLIKELILTSAMFSVLFISGHIITEQAMKISELILVPIFFIGTLLAIGTCLPELSFAITATKRKHGELGFGDILGNVFADCMATIGIIAIISPIKPEFPQLAIFSGALMLLALLALVALFFIKKQITKKEGAALIILYIIFIMIQFLFENTAAKTVS